VSADLVTIYVNGLPEASVGRIGTPMTSADPVTIGGAPIHVGFSGELDEVRMYSRCLSASEIQGIYEWEQKNLRSVPAQPPPSAKAPVLGTILREVWMDIPGNQVGDLTRHPSFSGPPSSSTLLEFFEAPTNAVENYGARIRGYLHPPQTGNYTFWISGDDDHELWLSTDETPANLVRVAGDNGVSGQRAWDALPRQKSASIALKAGQRYYVEALHKQGVGVAYVAVGWQLPDGSMERPIPGSRLSPIVGQLQK